MYAPPPIYENFRPNGIARGGWQFALIDRTIFPLFGKPRKITLEIAREDSFAPWHWVESGVRCDSYVDAAAMAWKMRQARGEAKTQQPLAPKAEL